MFLLRSWPIQHAPHQSSRPMSWRWRSSCRHRLMCPALSHTWSKSGVSVASIIHALNWPSWTTRDHTQTIRSNRSRQRLRSTPARCCRITINARKLCTRCKKWCTTLRQKIPTRAPFERGWVIIRTIRRRWRSWPRNWRPKPRPYFILSRLLLVWSYFFVFI